MPTGPGGLDANGVWQYGEDDTEALASDLLNLGMASVSDALAVLQIVRGTDATNRTTTSTDFIDSNLSVTITPRFASSTIIITTSQAVYVSRPGTTVAVRTGSFQITDSADTPMSGAEGTEAASQGDNFTDPVHKVQHTMHAYDSPDTLSPVTYKVRYKSSAASTTVAINNNINTGQMFAMEVAA